MTQAPPTYTTADLTVLEGLEPVRKRPGMYIGGVGKDGLHHLVWEVLDNSIDEAMNGHASEVQVTLHADRTSVSVSDNGRGIPVDIDKKLKKSGLEIILTTLHAGGKFDGNNYKASGGLHGVGASVVNALSKKLTASVKRDGKQYRMEFARGVPQGKLMRGKGAVRGSGTTITFEPDPTIFPEVRFDPQVIRQRLLTASYLHRGIKIIWQDEAGDGREVFQHESGLSDYLTDVLKVRKTQAIHDPPFTLEKEQDHVKLELAFAWTESTDEHVRSYVNGIPTGSGGSHEAGFRAGLLKAVRNYIETHNLTPRGVKIQPEDIREGVVGIVSIFIADPQFQGQTKDKLNNPQVQPAVDGAVRPALEQWLNTNRSVAEAVVARVIAASRARAASRAASAAVSRKSATANRLTLPGKLADCSSPGREDSELFIVEGDSAGGSAKQGRDRATQAILPLRGKVLNTWDAGLKKVLDNRELADLVTALGCGLKPVELSKLRYGRIILLADADSDGHHITTLLLTFFFRHLPELLREGKVYLAMPPLYRVDLGKRTFWADDDEHRDAILAEHGNGKTPEITRFKGLGEMPAKTLWETTLDPASRRLLQVDTTDSLEADSALDDLMGKDPLARFRFIMDHAAEAQEVDV